MTDLPRVHLAALCLAALTLFGCAESEGDVEAQSANVISGSIAEEHPEAVLVTMRDGYGPIGECSGTLIAPGVVLTAGHCVDRADSWMIVAPFASGQWRRATRGEVYDWDVGANATFDKHDVGVILLDQPIMLDSYPTIAAEPLPHGDEAVVIGRTFQGDTPRGGMFDSHPLYVSDPIILLHYFDPAVADLHPLYYGTRHIMIERGDSGGPVYAYDAAPDAPRELIGVVSATHYVFRIETVRDWVNGFIEPTP